MASKCIVDILSSREAEVLIDRFPTRCRPSATSPQMLPAVMAVPRSGENASESVARR